ncbi:HAD family phosphatase [Mucilaginibacter sp. Bleaf8]|uniref:HAD family hydrolase n=1 Tax=Mucilaginibacter sp. Bleaf8 TaxID=2834430 RepID=UPI001BCC5775|nr:HAD family phosphatase [Mucilaginibacter sp. Bleaf8]MBS7565944.1 HAD family phosphatase [Mucilaginibacter sp. Bleaf8]
MDALNQQKYDALVKISQDNFKAFLYDCDGTLADNMQAHKDTYIRVAAEQGVAIEGDIIDELAGWPIIKVVEQINERYGCSFDSEEFNALKYKLYYNEYIERTQPIEYVVNHLKNHAGQVRIGVVSGGSREAIQKTLQVLGIDHMVEVLVCAGETEHGKPYPDPFLKAAEQLGIAPEHCLVFEDGDAGVQAAEAAGMRWVRIDKLIS